MIKLPYGISNFKRLVDEKKFYQDRTHFIELLEEWNNPYLFFLRPRRFGKSLFVSVLEYYYDKKNKDDFESIFGKYYIGKNPTPLANQYLVLKFDFSGVHTETKESVFRKLLEKIQTDVEVLMYNYSELFKKEDFDLIKRTDSPASVITSLFGIIRKNKVKEKIYVIIDEYDHFTNELIAFNLNDFREIVSQNGFVRKFFEVLKIGTQSGIIDRIFSTGISPITLDSLTSGFNIATNISLTPEFHNMMGFTESEVGELLTKIGIEPEKTPTVLNDIRDWYNGYLFEETVKSRLYNPDMVLYFAKEYAQRKTYPKTMLDMNIASDYGKINRMFKISSEKENFKIIEELLETKTVNAILTLQFSFERRWTKHDFVSLLFYMGLLTVEGSLLSTLKFRIPNYVIEELFFKYFHETLKQRSELYAVQGDAVSAVIQLAQENNIQPILKEVKTILTTLSNRDAMRFSEKHLKVILASLFHVANVYFIKSEPEEHRKYIDLLLLRRPPIDPNFQFAFELKYLKKEEAHLMEKIKKEAVEQLKGYLKNEPFFNMTDLKAWVIVVVGHEEVVAEKVI